ncbi:MAG: RNA polymerase sigma factor [Pirellulaceae bacterium]
MEISWKASALDLQPITDECQLMQRLAAGDNLAMQSLIAQFGPMLQRLIGRLTAWDDASDDLLQEVLVKAWDRASEFRGTGSLEGWLRQIAVNQCRNHFRSQDLLRRMKTWLWHNTNEASENQQLHQMETAEWTRHNLAQLHHQDRALLVLFYLEERTGDEIGRLLNLKVETVHVRLHRARQRLKQIMTQDQDYA